MTQAEIKAEIGTNILFQDIMKTIKSGKWKQSSEAEKGFEHHKYALTIHNGIIFRSVVPIYSTQTTTLGFGQSARDTSWKKCS